MYVTWEKSAGLIGKQVFLVPELSGSKLNDVMMQRKETRVFLSQPAGYIWINVEFKKGAFLVVKQKVK